MTARFACNLCVLLAGAFLTCAAQGFGTDVLSWAGLAAGCVVAVVVLFGFATHGRGVAQRALDFLMFATAGWVVVATRAFGGHGLEWIVFSAGALLITLAVIGLVLHETLLELTIQRSRNLLPVGAGSFAANHDGAARPVETVRVSAS